MPAGPAIHAPTLDWIVPHRPMTPCPSRGQRLQHRPPGDVKALFLRIGPGERAAGSHKRGTFCLFRRACAGDSRDMTPVSPSQNRWCTTAPWRGRECPPWSARVRTVVMRLAMHSRKRSTIACQSHHALPSTTSSVQAMTADAGDLQCRTHFVGPGSGKRSVVGEALQQCDQRIRGTTVGSNHDLGARKSGQTRAASNRLLVRMVNDNGDTLDVERVAVASAIQFAGQDLSKSSPHVDRSGKNVCLRHNDR